MHFHYAEIFFTIISLFQSSNLLYSLLFFTIMYIKYLKPIRLSSISEFYVGLYTYF